MSRSRNTFEIRVLRKVKLGEPSTRPRRDASIRSVHAGAGHGERVRRSVTRTNTRPTFAERVEARQARGRDRLSAMLSVFGVKR